MDNKSNSGIRLNLQNKGTKFKMAMIMIMMMMMEFKLANFFPKQYSDDNDIAKVMNNKCLITIY